MELDANMEAFQEILKQSKNIVAIAGAGLSAGSGIPTFRGAGGLWRKYDAISLATPEAFRSDPSLVWQFYHYRRTVAGQKSPNAAHCALASLSIPSVLKRVAPNAESFTLVTQNIDGLSTRAFREVAQRHSLSERDTDNLTRDTIIEMHGRLFDVLCTDSSCGHREHNTTNPICPALAGTEEITELHHEIDEWPAIAPLDLPRCSKCDALARPGVVWFGEGIQRTYTIDSVVEKADLALVVGTSSTVYPASGYQSTVAGSGGNVAVFNIEDDTISSGRYLSFVGKCEEILPAALFGANVPEHTGAPIGERQ